MARRYPWHTVLISLALAACRSTQPPPTPTSVPASEPAFSPSPRVSEPPARATQTPVPAATAPLESAAIPPSTPEPLGATGPYLVYQDAMAAGPGLIFIDADGYGMGRLTLPPGYRTEGNLAKGLSPAGDRLVVYAGSAAGPDSAHDLRLAILNLETGLPEFETGLLSAAYPQDLQQLFRTQIAPRLGADPQDAQIFQEGIGSTYLTQWDWSPNGRYLAYAGQSDGPSTDLYLLDTRTGQRRRLSDGLEQVVDIRWSPDGRRILNGSSNEFGQGMPIHFWSADVTTDTNVDLGIAEAGSAFWVDAEHAVIHANVNGPYNRKEARLVDVVSGATHVIWPGWFGYLSLNLEAQTAAVTGCPSGFRSESECGRFAVDLASGVATRTGDASPYADSGHLPADPSARRLRDAAGNTLTLMDDHVEVETASGVVYLPVGNRELWDAGSAFVLSPDLTLAFLGVEEALWVLDLQSGEARLIDPQWTGGSTNGSSEGWAAWATRAPKALIGALSATPQPSGEGGIRLTFLLGDLWRTVSQPLKVFDSATNGTRVLPLPVRSHPEWGWYVALSPRRDFLAYYPNDTAALPRWSDLMASDYQLWIQDLRTGAFVQRIDLLSSAVTTLIATTPLENWEIVPAVPALGVARSLGENLAWSPDGRYLAFSAATRGPTADLYVFDSQARIVRQLTHETMSVGLPFWSPDSSRIVVRELLDYEAFGDNCDFCWPGETLTVGLDGSLVRLTDDLAIHLAGWTSPQSFLTFATPFEAPSMYLAEADLQAGTVREVVPGGFGSATASAITGDIWVLFHSDGMFRSFDVADGLYHYNRESRALEPANLGATWSGSIAYIPRWDAFAITSSRATSELPVTLSILEPDGTLRFRVEGVEAFSLRDFDKPWLKVFSNQSGWRILDSAGQSVATLGDGCASWLPEAAGVLFVPKAAPATAQVLLAARGWKSQPAEIPVELCSKGTILSIEVP